MNTRTQLDIHPASTLGRLALTAIVAGSLAIAPAVNSAVIETEYEPIGPSLPGSTTGLGGTTNLVSYSRFGSGQNQNQDLPDRPLASPAPQVFVPGLGNQPALGINGIRKGEAGRTTLGSSSGNGQANSVSFYDGLGNFGVCGSFSGAFSAGAFADAACIDPVSVDGTLLESYLPTINLLTIDIGGIGESIRVEYFAQVDDQPIYSLVIEAADQLLTAADLSISFMGDPSLGVSPTQVESSILGAFSVTAGTATLATNTEIFNVSSFTPPVAGELSDGVRSFAQVTPPTTVTSSGSAPVAFLVMGLALMIARRRQR